MASKSLFPPIIESSMPAFLAGNGCRFYFRLSKFNAPGEFQSIHVSVVKQDTNENQVNTTIPTNQAGIILNVQPERVEGNLYTFLLTSRDDGDHDIINGWTAGWTYKVQIRLDKTKGFDPNGKQTTYEWLNQNEENFSEWSTVCVVKAINKINYTIDILDINTKELGDYSNSITTLSSSTLPISGQFNKEDCLNEDIYSYNFILYDHDDKILENSGTIFANQFQNNKSFNYVMKTELTNGATYKLEFKYETVNHYIGGAYKYELYDGTEIDNRYTFIADFLVVDSSLCSLITADYDPDNIIKGETSVHQEEEEGRIGLKIYSSTDLVYSGNLCIRRSDSRDNFQTWTDIKIYVCKQTIVNNIPILYDYSIESGVWYIYGVQKIDEDGARGILDPTSAIIRNFEYSYLLGKDEKQLKLMFDNSMSSFKIQQQEAKIDPIGGTYPVITRNAATKYRTFPITGLISQYMDDNNLFTSKQDIYKYNNVVSKYQEYNKNHGISQQYDYTYERDFRQQVLDFLQDGEIKVFKSSTEGNVLVRLMDVSYTPNQSLDRMLYSFSATAYEIAENNYDNYVKYGFINPGEYATSFATYETRMGQIQLSNFIPLMADGITSKEEPYDIIDLIYQKYDSKNNSNNPNLGGYRKTVLGIHNIRITFDGIPLNILYNNKRADDNNRLNEIVGYNFKLNNKVFTVHAPVQMYEFDDQLVFTRTDHLYLCGDADGVVENIPATIDFLYDISTEPYKEKKVLKRTSRACIGQIFKTYSPFLTEDGGRDGNIRTDIYYKYYFETDHEFRRLSNLNCIEIEANPGVIIGIQDLNDTSIARHVINETGVLRINDITAIGEKQALVYLGIMKSDGSIDNTKKADLLINYYAVLIEGTYDTSTT